MSAKVRVFLVDDHPLLRKGIGNCINAEPDLGVCGEAGDASAAIEGIARLRPDVALVDISIPGRDGIELIKSLRALGNTTRLLVFSMHDESLYAVRALRAGASGYVMKSDPEQRLLDAIRAVHAGQVVLSERLDKVLLRQAVGQAARVTPEPLAQLSDRELQVLRLFGEGCERKQIASELKLSIKTVESHRASICHKLGLPGSNRLAAYAAALTAKTASPPAPAAATTPATNSAPRTRRNSDTRPRRSRQCS